MAALEDTWARIQSFFQLYRDIDSLELSERRQRMLKIVGGMKQFQQDMDYFLQHAPPADLRRDICLDLKQVMEKGRQL